MSASGDLPMSGALCVSAVLRKRERRFPNSVVGARRVIRGSREEATIPTSKYSGHGVELMHAPGVGVYHEVMGAAADLNTRADELLRALGEYTKGCLLYTSPSPRDRG